MLDGDILLPPAKESVVLHLRLGADDFAAGGERAQGHFVIGNRLDADGIRVHLSAPESPWLSVSPSEIGLGPGARLKVRVRVATDLARAAVEGGAAPAAPLRLRFHRLDAEGDDAGERSPGTETITLGVHLPLARCPECRHLLGDPPDGGAVHTSCPGCHVLLRPCPRCYTPNTWLARRCVLNPDHVVRAAADWPMLGGGPEHRGSLHEWADPAFPIPGPVSPPSLSRRWWFPSGPPSRAVAALAWSAPAAAYGLIAATAATSQGEAHLYAFETTKGALLWEPYALRDPVYPEHGGVALAGGHLYAATIRGLVVCVDALRGSRVWEVALASPGGGREPMWVYGAVVPAAPEDGAAPVLVAAVSASGTGCLYALGGASGETLWQATLAGAVDTAPAAAGGRAFVHDGSGALSAFDLQSGAPLWSVACGARLKAAPVIVGESVFSATDAGTLFCHDARTGAPVWRWPGHAEQGGSLASFSGTPACDGKLLYVPAEDGIHLFNLTSNRAVGHVARGLRVLAAPVLAGGILFFGAQDGNLYGVRSHGRQAEALYPTGVGSRIVAAPALADGALFVAATNGVLYGLSLEGRPG